ncbi:hypothetical protein Droror1_Dr00022073 [Drosera rotundifolia]
MATNTLPSQITPPALHFSKHLHHHHNQRRPPLRITPLASTGSRSNGTDTTPGSEDDNNPLQQPASPPTTKPSSERLDLRSRRGAKRREGSLQRQAFEQMQQQAVERMQRELDTSDGLPKRETLPVAPPIPKRWEEMTMGEKALELYVGEKGLLFWLNKFAYASIFIVIGGWILFRFVGPALNLYQLDTPPLSPTTMLKTP